ncbi:DUF5666 domain-containing protein [uncultured Helicobacter sp.]|uniref:DUF5666 domain-containing protein n=1 Tax=uncultured Helicobacter sp. TaxID=175537 RepID=UPI0026137761|nr:DUF5666 domain-containing protein [uncultured Helicobacter sp.]
MSPIKTFVSIFAFATSVAMASDIKGTIQAIDDTNKTITVNGVVIKVMPYTEIEQDGCGIGWDTYKTFSELKVDDVVEIDVFYDNGKMIAKEIEIGCWKAY